MRKKLIVLAVATLLVGVLGTAVVLWQNRFADQSAARRCLTQVDPPFDHNGTRTRIERSIANQNSQVRLENLYFDIQKINGVDHTVYAGRFSDGTVGIWSSLFDYQYLRMSYSSVNDYAQMNSAYGKELPEWRSAILANKATDTLADCALRNG